MEIKETEFMRPPGRPQWAAGCPERPISGQEIHCFSLPFWMQ